ncbi:hypothetical protein K1W69_01615 [Hoeflea sp. WL0058]|uniref:Uncharacterized protein n=1 Tax=Flavimaribacter sediminis TaxID=2865987 RepID=A0AAE2ZJV0_9HYPH|nr:hypothetical protein [Flavimaribacter sediminis]MBW8635865.1 hypothetical protein [Flavimaribacter sediminis]
MAINETHSNGRRFIDWRLSVGNIITILGMIIGGLSMWLGLGERVTLLETNLTSQAADIVQMSGRLQRVEERAGDVRERLKGIEVTQQQQNETLKRILQAVENQ